MSRGSTMLLIFGTVLAAGAAVFSSVRSIRCDDIVGVPVWSPDGKWVVTPITKSCPAGPLSSTNYSVFVTLGSKSLTSFLKTPVQIFDTNDAAEPPTPTWANQHDLVLQVNEEGSVEISKHEVGDVRIRYTVPKWIWDSLGSVESDRVREEHESQELYKEGKLSTDDLRVEGEIIDAAAKERSHFRQWILDNATVEGNGP